MKSCRVSLSLFCVFMGILSVSSASAADFNAHYPLPSIPFTPAIAPAVSVNWEGPYIGINRGAVWSESRNVRTGAAALIDDGQRYGPAASMASGASGVLTINAKVSFIGGGQVGYTKKVADIFLAGFEADIAGVLQTSKDWGAAQYGGGFSIGGLTNVFAPQLPATSVIQANRALDYIGTLRARFGVLATKRIALYATGGLAYGGVQSRTLIYQTLGANSFGAGYGARSDLRAGWTVGGGVEYKVSAYDHISLRAEYLYYDLGDLAYATVGALTYGGGPAYFAGRSQAHFNGHVVRAGLNYQFNLDERLAQLVVGY